MADVDIDSFVEHDRTESRTDEPMDEHNPLIPGVGGSTWEPGQSHMSAEREQETSFGGESQRIKLMKDYVKDLYKKISENIGEAPEPFHYNYFKVEGWNYTT